MQLFLSIVIYLLCMKAVTGYHFPWEICNCCKKKIKDHVK